MLTDVVHRTLPYQGQQSLNLLLTFAGILLATETGNNKVWWMDNIVHSANGIFFLNLCIKLSFS